MRDLLSRSDLTIALVAALAIGACAAPGEQSSQVNANVNLGTTKQRIVGGTPSNATQDATVMLIQGGQFACTATLIAPNLILTARHCVSELNESSACGTATSDSAASSFSISIGVNAGPSKIAARGTKMFVGPNDLCGADIALIQLDKNVTGAKIAPIRFKPLTVNESTVAVGYGDDGTGKDTPGRFQRTGVQVIAVGPAQTTWKGTTQVDVPDGDVETTESTCFGDSGGPLFDAQLNVVGVTSRGIDDACIDRPTLWTGLPRHEKLIRDAAATAGHPLTEAGTTPPPSDKDDEDDADNPRPKNDDSAGDDEDEDNDSSSDEEEETTSKPSKKPKKSTTQAAAGCAMTQHAPSTTSLLASFALIGLALGARRRRK